ncbi:hypothetical protein [Clostridium frigidicarnis]|uniref:Uncharacterized protein n=1 Tax=Clostridium frigidicarnis TaxID=84698 RepID=A0A1I0XSE9_9CLOT|nr:hypothetical protein [Clostridium frigidicarnis]SFB03366.1 hypothetical protein SAMN04488528_100994 [Clostridium frigidicarnis]
MKSKKCKCKGKKLTTKLGAFLVRPKKQSNRWIEINITIINNNQTIRDKFTKIFN